MQLSEKSRKVQGMFDKIAPRYDLLNRLLSARQDVRWRRKMVAELPAPKRAAGVLIDVACGTGDVLLEAARRRPDYSVLHGVDISAGMMERGRERSDLAAASAARGGSWPPAPIAERLTEASERPLARFQLDFTLGSAESLPMAEGSADAVTIAFGLRNVDDRARALREFHRVLRPGGRLLILEFFEPEGSLLSSAFRMYFKHVLPAIGGMISDRDAYRYLPESVTSMPSPNELLWQLNQAGFVDTEQSESWLDGAARLLVGEKAPGH